MPSLRSGQIIGILLVCTVIGVFFHSYDHNERVIINVIDTEGALQHETSIQLSGHSWENSRNKTFIDMSLEDRLNFVRQRCAEVRKWKSYRVPRVEEVAIYNETNISLIACNNHKVGSTTILDLFYHINNVTGLNRDRFRKKVLVEYATPQAINAIKYTKFMFVREPLERLLSAYLDNRAIPHVHGKKMTFKEFLINLIRNKNSIPNSHHMTFYDRCQPCDVNYDFYGTMSSFSRDMSAILNHAGVDVSEVPKVNAVGKTKDQSKDKIIAELSRDIKKQIYNLYKMDYYIFGYPKPYAYFPKLLKKKVNENAKKIK